MKIYKNTGQIRGKTGHETNPWQNGTRDKSVAKQDSGQINCKTGHWANQLQNWTRDTYQKRNCPVKNRNK